ncbi:MAG: hypothetical protein ACI38A_06885 [Candidatus Ornithomonoglobus sp.]
MTTIKGQRFLTVHATAGEVYEIEYTVPPKVSIANNTDGNIFISTDPEFADDDTGTAGSFLELQAGGAANNISMSFYKVYIKAENSGSIVIVRCG